MAKETKTPMTSERQHPLPIRFTKEESDLIEQAARLIGTNRSQYIRQAAIRQARKDIRDAKN